MNLAFYALEPVGLSFFKPWQASVMHPHDRYMMVSVGQTVLVLVGVMIALIFVANYII